MARLGEKREENSAVFEDYLPVVAEKLGEEGLMDEMCNGFRLLADAETGVITFDSLKRNAAVLGMESMKDEELRAMIEEGDLDGDGVLDMNEFCVLMIRLSPSFMVEAEKWLQKAAMDIIHTFDFDSSVRASIQGWGSRLA